MIMWWRVIRRNTPAGLPPCHSGLEYVRGEVYANVWQSDRVARMSPETGAVLGWIDLTGLLSAADLRHPVDVLNGIAYDPGRERLFVTGKW